MPRSVAFLLLAALAARAEDGLGVRVNRALDRAAQNLVRRQAEDGSWQKDDKVHPLGRTALCTYALLHAGRATDDPAVKKALGFLRLDDPLYFTKVEPHSTYEAGCLLLLLHALGPQHDKHIHRICAWLVKNFHQGQKLWGYPTGAPDLSNTQFAVFGLRVGALHGFKVPKDVWRALLKSVPKLQHRDGAFRYKADQIYRASMTHAGLIVLRFALESLRVKRPPKEIRQAIARGHAWFERYYRVDRTPWGRGYHKGYYYYYMYGLARYAQIFHLKRIGAHDWYREGAEELLRRQDRDGSWGNLEDTSFAILFLRKVVFTRPQARTPAAAGEEAAEKPAAPRPDKDVPFLREWLVVGPFRGPRFEDDMLFDPPLRLDRVSPGPGRRAGKLKWVSYASPEDKIDLAKPCAHSDWASYLAAVYLHVPAATDAVLWLGSDDGAKVYLDGKRVLDGHHHDYCGDDFYRVPLRLAAGRHLLLVHVENHAYGVHFKLRLSNPDGAALTAVRASVKRR